MISKTKQIKELKYSLLLPVLLAGIFIYTSYINETRIVSKESQSKVLLFEKENLKEKKETAVLRDRNKIYSNVNIDTTSYLVIAKSPVFPGCKGKDERRCFSKSIKKHFSENFNSGVLKQLGLLPGKKKIVIDFSIDKRGNVVNIKVKAPHLDIENEVKRVIKTLPQMIPGESSEGKKISVKHQIPLTLNVR